MKHNIGRTDRVFRLVVAAALIAAGLWYDKWFWAAGLYFLITGLFSWCLLYRLFRFNTLDKKGTN